MYMDTDSLPLKTSPNKSYDKLLAARFFTLLQLTITKVGDKMEQ